MATRLPNYQMRDGRTRLGQSYFNPIWADLDNRLDTLERIRLNWQTQVAQLRDLGLQRIDEYIRPVVDEVDALLAQATEETNGLAANLVHEYINPLIERIEQILQQAQQKTDNLAQQLVDQHIGPLLTQAQQLLSQIQRTQQTASADATAIAERLANSNWQAQLDTIHQQLQQLEHALEGKANAQHSHALDDTEQLPELLQELAKNIDVLDYQEFTASGTWQKHPKAKLVYVEVVGAGAAGAACCYSTTSSPIAYGGGGGGFASRLYRAKELPTSTSVLVGSGGPPAVAQPGSNTLIPGGNGGLSRFGVSPWLTRAPGGNASQGGFNDVALGDSAMWDHLGGNGHGNNFMTGSGQSSVNGGAGGGAAKTNGSSGSTQTTNGGQSWHAGNAGAGTAARSPNISIIGNAGHQPGGGGGGAHAYVAAHRSETVTSGSGAPGIVRVWQW